MVADGPDRGGSTAEDTGSCVSLVPVFSGLTAVQQAEVATLARPRLVARGEMVFRAGEPAASLYVVHEGRIRISRLSAGGQERVLRILGPGEVVGESAFLTGRRPENDAVAVENARMCVFAHARLDNLVRTYPDIAVAMLRAVSARLVSTERMLAAMTNADVPARVAAYLLDCEVVAGDGGKVRVRLPVAKKDIASFLGTTPETLSRTFATLTRQNLIGPAGQAEVEILNMTRLEALAAGI